MCAGFVGMNRLRALLAFIFRRARRPRIVRRMALRCPHDCEIVEVDILEGPDAGRRPVLRCSARPECPPTCDHACRLVPPALRETRALLIFPADSKGVPDDVG
jgi:hypothetical protein